MEDGYLIVETHSERPGLVRIHAAETAPTELEMSGQAGPQICYVGHFDDLSAAQMQLHTRLHRRLVDIETGLYRSDAIAAVAAAESLELRHRRVYLAPDFAENLGLDKTMAKHRWRHRLADRLWQLVGIAAIAFLLVKILFGF